jgi:hypothetical protein
MKISEVRDLLSEIEFYELSGKFSIADNLTKKLVKLSYDAQISDLSRAGKDTSGEGLAKMTISMDVLNNFLKTIDECNAIQGGIFTSGNPQERAMEKAKKENIDPYQALNKVLDEDADDPVWNRDPNYMACADALSAKSRELQNNTGNNQAMTTGTQSQTLQTPHAPPMLQ